MKNLYVDFDGVLVDTIKVTYELIRKKGIDWNNPMLIREFYCDLDWEEIIRISPVIENNIERLKIVISKNQYHVSILTHVVSLKEAEAKIKFLRSMGIAIPVIPCPRDVEKAEIVNPKNSILIDDYSSNLSKWKEAGGIPVQFKQKITSSKFMCINKIDDILELKIN